MKYHNARTMTSRLAAMSLAATAVCLLVPAAARAFPGSDKPLAQAERALRQGEYERAEQIYRELLNKDAHDNAARLGLSFALLKQRDLQQAYDHAARALLLNPLSARAHALLGAAILAAGGFHESIEEFRTALSLNENESLAVNGLAMIDFYENRLDLALRGLRHAAELDPNEPDYIFNLGQAAARNEKYKEAADSYERFLQIAPKTDADRRARIRGLIDFLRYLGKQGSLYELGGANRTIVHFEMVDTRPILLVRINGEKSPLRFVLDTGSGMSVVSELTARRLGLRTVARGGLARAVGGGGRFEIAYGFLSSMEIGDVRVGNVPVYIRHFYDEKAPVDGYIGLSVITKFITSVDYGEHTFALTRQRQSVSPNLSSAASGSGPQPANSSGATLVRGVEIPVRTTASGFLSGEVRLEGIEKPFNFIIDTGATVSVVAEKLAALDELSGYVQASNLRVFGAAGIAENVKMLVLPRIMLGTFQQERLGTAVLDLEPVNETAGFQQNGILGGNFLSHFRISFDFQRGVIRLEPLNQTPTSSEGIKPSR
jgi:tetratricopeptide (TPR) repeat protein/predicted aspartyl protease